MSAKPSASIDDMECIYENTPVRIMVNRKCPEIQLPGLTIGPLEEGKEYEVKFWVAKELEKAGVARFRDEELLDTVKLYKLHWKESVQPVKQIAPLPEGFYPKLRRYLNDLKGQGMKKPEKRTEYEKVTRLAQDIINCRLKKIVSLSSAPEQSNQILNNLTKEERALYKSLYAIISEWGSKILKVKVRDES
ncbi:MAG: hypothetical protein OEX77_02055 [Candidatus Bathyarchaeota archaeon]|nr:hypothetical protein [Candidatus Bathyarchaeota archaeon]